jgi:hypothetical protein
MNLPNYFLADQPPEATLSVAMLTETCQTLKRNRRSYLASRTTQSLVELLCLTAKQWLDPEFPFRKLALEKGPKATGFPRATLANGLDSFFKQLTPDNFQALLEQDLGHGQRLDDMLSTAPEQRTGRAAVATAPEFLAHVVAGSLPNPALQSIVLGLLLRSAQLVKCATGTSLLPRLFAHSLYEGDRKLGACLEIAEWRGGNTALERILFEQADCVMATGSDETVAAIRGVMPKRTRLVAYAHRLSFAYLSSGVLSRAEADELARRAAADVTAWNQLGCLSPHVIYVEAGGQVSVEQFAALLAGELARREESEPRGDLPVETSAVIASRRSFYDVRAAHSADTRQWCSKGSTAWTVVYEADPKFQVSCLHRFVYVKGVTSLTEALESADGVRGSVSTVGLAAPQERARELATALARWGVTRVCPLGQMQNPPLTWRHDGRPALGELITWTDWET